MAVIVAASNYLVTIPVTSIFGIDMNAATGFAFSDYVQWAAFSYPIAFRYHEPGLWAGRGAAGHCRRFYLRRRAVLVFCRSSDCACFR